MSSRFSRNIEHFKTPGNTEPKKNNVPGDFVLDQKHAWIRIDNEYKPLTMSFLKLYSNNNNLLEIHYDNDTREAWFTPHGVADIKSDNPNLLTVSRDDKDVITLHPHGIAGILGDGFIEVIAGENNSVSLKFKGVKTITSMDHSVKIINNDGHIDLSVPTNNPTKQNDQFSIKSITTQYGNRTNPEHSNGDKININRLDFESETVNNIHTLTYPIYLNINYQDNPKYVDYSPWINVNIIGTSNGDGSQSTTTNGFLITSQYLTTAKTINGYANVPSVYLIHFIFTNDSLSQYGNAMITFSVDHLTIEQYLNIQVLPQA